ncbi:MAG: hypothetical protein IK130_05600 [Oscillospiraceae bacterium]|nr:hypothetical protein [Oscillospiraceae bacterium]
MGIIKGLLGAAAFVTIGSLIVSKAHTKSPDSILKKARRMHGACTLISSEERDGKIYVTVRDDLQGFTYTLCSAMQDMSCDGSALFRYENTTDDFDRRLFECTLDVIRPQIEAVLAFFGATADFTYTEDQLMTLYVPDITAAPDLTARCFQIWQQYNLNRRFDGKRISVCTAPREHVGSMVLPQNIFLDAEGERIRWVEQHLRSFSGRADIRYLRTEPHTLAEIGCPPERVSPVTGEYYPQKPDDPVKCYYFLISGMEYFAADFFDNRTGNLYMNYQKQI